jgi:hypothetical protein
MYRQAGDLSGLEDFQFQGNSWVRVDIPASLQLLTGLTSLGVGGNMDWTIPAPLPWPLLRNLSVPRHAFKIPTNIQNFQKYIIYKTKLQGAQTQII